MGSIEVFKRNVNLNIIKCITVFVLGIDVALGEYRAIVIKPIFYCAR